ncbi:penicillin acylase family protein [Oceanobacillus sp. CAU 1775]
MNRKTKRPIKKIILITLGIILLVILLAALFANWYVGRSVEKVEGEIALPILKQEVTVLTDGSGVPHIRAENEQDLYMAQGYVQAQHRIFQMELSRRQASGTLSEVIGEGAVEQDKYFRTLGLRRAAEESYEIYSEEGKQVLEWFAAGVNAFIEDAIDQNSLPPEFMLMGIEPGEWTPIDSLTIGKFMAFDLGGNWERQAFNYYALQQFPEEKAYELFPVYPENRPTIIDNTEIDIVKSFEHVVIPHEFNGSNNWVVSGEKTTSGKPLLANDPHLGLATPSIWLQMHLEAPEVNVSGVIFAGVPGIILGHNESIAWGVTNTGPDVQQLYIEERNPDNPEEFLFEDEWEQAEIIDEPIAVKDGETVDYQVVVTRHGPIISEFAEEAGNSHDLSLKWTALEPTTELEAILEMNKASNWEEFERGLEKFLVPTQNFVFAGNDGTIAYKANGNIPIYENPEQALLPMRGWLAEDELNDYIPFDELPRVVNPDKGYIATANNKVVGDDYPYHISHVWAQPYRYERIAEVLETGEALAVEDMQQLQMDAHNLQAREFIPAFTQLLSNASLTEKEQAALDMLEKWNYIDLAETTEPLIFQRWMTEIESILYVDIPEPMMDMFSVKGQTTDIILRKGLTGEDSIWLAENEGIQEVVHQGLEQAISHLETTFGEEMDAWQWGDHHRVAFRHPLSDIHPVLEYFLNNTKPQPMNGSAHTVMAAAYNKETGIVNHGAPWRYVIDLADTETAYHLNGPGQSGHFKSDYYHNQFEDWVEGNFHETNLNETEGKVLRFINKNE